MSAMSWSHSKWINFKFIPKEESIPNMFVHTISKTKTDQDKGRAHPGPKKQYVTNQPSTYSP